MVIENGTGEAGAGTSASVMSPLVQSMMIPCGMAYFPRSVIEPASNLLAVEGVMRMACIPADMRQTMSLRVDVNASNNVAELFEVRLASAANAIPAARR